MLNFGQKGVINNISKTSKAFLGWWVVFLVLMGFAHHAEAQLNPGNIFVADWGSNLRII